MPTNNWCMELNPQERSHTQQGTVYVFANVYMYPEKQGTTGKMADPRSYCIQKTLQAIAHDGDVDGNGVTDAVIDPQSLR